MGYFDQIKAQVAEMIAEKKKQAADRKIAEVISETRPQTAPYVPRTEGTRRNLSDKIKSNMKKGRALPKNYQADTPPKKSPTTTELLQAKMGDFLARATDRKKTVSEKETPSEHSNKNTSGLSKGGQ